MIRKYAEIFCWKNVSSFCSAKATHIFSAKNIRILCIESARTVNEITLNELVKLTTLWTTGPWTATWSLLLLFINKKKKKKKKNDNNKNLTKSKSGSFVQLATWSVLNNWARCDHGKLRSAPYYTSIQEINLGKKGFELWGKFTVFDLITALCA